MHDLTSAIQQSAESAASANPLAVSAASSAEHGGRVVSEVVSKMHDITASSRKIVDITSVIDGIAFQTNIFALNASVEAARAGEQGRGFAIVASEVRSLAQRSAASAREIKTLIGTSVENVESGSRLVNEAGSTMTDIVEGVRSVATTINEISRSTAQQTGGIVQVKNTLSELDQMTQQNATLVEQKHRRGREPARSDAAPVGCDDVFAYGLIQRSPIALAAAPGVGPSRPTSLRDGG